MPVFLHILGGPFLVGAQTGDEFAGLLQFKRVQMEEDQQLVSPVRFSDEGCECQRTWSYKSQVHGNSYIKNYCGNPDNDPVGAWCRHVANCDKSHWTWGYCPCYEAYGARTFPEAPPYPPPRNYLWHDGKWDLVFGQRGETQVHFGYCAPQNGNSWETDFCRNYPTNKECLDTSLNYLPDSCDHHCARKMCAQSALCSGYTELLGNGKDRLKSSFKLKSLKVETHRRRWQARPEFVTLESVTVASFVKAEPNDEYSCYMKAEFTSGHSC